MKFFEAVPSELFSPLASPNRILYADALDVLYAAYQENLKIREDVLYSMLRGRLEQELADATFEDEDIDEEELRDISGRARFLIRKLCSKGWFEKERGDDFEEYITIPNYSSRLLELFHQLRDDSPARGYSYVFGTFSVLKTADDSNNAYDKMTALYSAYDNTTALISLLQMVYHNVKHYFQTQINMQDVNQVLAAHFNDFGQKVVEAYIRPLKIKDSVPKYRVPIQSVLRRWEEDDTLLIAMANEALRDKRGKTLEDCRADLLRKIFWIEERYDNLEKDYLEEIDTQVRRYTRAATQKIKNDEKGTKALFFISQAQIKALATLAVADDIEDKKAYKEALQKALRKNPSVDIALFGRMVADDPSLNFDAAAQVAHSISTHAVQNEYDYFTAVDDCQAEDNAGAGHLGTVEYNSATLYRYATVNVMELERHLDAKKAAEVVRSFGEAFIRSMPTGKQNTFANRTLPDAVYVTIREDQPVNLCGAFERAVRKSAEGYAEPSKSALQAYAQQLYQSFAEAPAESFTVGTGLEALAPAQPLNAMLDALEEAVKENLTGNEVE